MMRFLTMLGATLAIAAAPQAAYACKGAPADDGSNEYTICPEHYPADAPRFEDYPARPYTGPVAAVRLHGDHEARLYRSRLREAAKSQHPNFAGHFILAHWGCGSGCSMNKIIDARSGKVFHPAGVESNVVVNIDDSFFDNGGTLRYRPDSRLLVLIGDPEEDENRRGISFFEWTGTRMKLLRHVKVPSGN
ncbi:hypothetical protein [Pseudoduganella violaceinigra]|uniref:hypothetical protein n=1 Tax=Pseudoduganella violaceinigra TaxID=246602 RepID=UPI000686279B|nr:hypothetical protein [Pseudoduganella violaceinigra]